MLSIFRAVFKMYTYLVFILLFMKTCAIYGEDAAKGSVTFVIDHTPSMREEIDQLKQRVHAILDAVGNSEDSQIEDFILVTFNDPGFDLRAITKDRYEFKNAVDSVFVTEGSYDCWECSMSGIKLGLEKSRPQSLLYVITDATAKDYGLYKEVEGLALKKQIPVTFLLTGDCRGFPAEVQSDTLYYDLAKATQGDVFNVMKNDIKDVTNYILEKVKGRDSLLVTKNFPPGYGNKVNYTVNGHMKDVLLTIGGDKPIAKVTGPNGTTPVTEVLVHKNKVLITNVINPVPGVYTAEVGSESETALKITAKTTINFVPRFSSIKPEIYHDTSALPAPAGKTYLSIDLQGKGVKLQTAVIRDMSGNVLHNLTLELVDEDTNFYRTEEFNPPDKFLVSIYGYDDKDNSTITRDATTPLKRRDKVYETSPNISPRVTIDKTPEIIVNYDAPLRLKCTIHGYPQPDIVWHEKETGIDFKGTVSEVDVAININILNIDKVKKNATYECRAKNRIGEDSESIRIGVIKYFNVVDVSRDVVQGKWIETPQVPDGITVHKVISTWEEAYLQCKSEGAVLASPINTELLNTMKSLISMNNAEYFIGTKASHYPGPFMSVEGVPLDNMTAAVLVMVQQLDPRNGDCLSMDEHNIRVIPCCIRLPFMCYRVVKDKNVTKTTTESTAQNSTTTESIEEDLTTTEEVTQQVTTIREQSYEKTMSEDDANTTKCGTNDTGYKYNEDTGSCYKKHTEGLNWDDASAACEAEHAHLLVIDDQKEMQVFNDMDLNDIDPYAFIGLRDYNQTGEWQTVTGKKLNEIGVDWHYARLQIKNASCAVLHSTGMVDNHSCFTVKAFICEKEVI